MRPTRIAFTLIAATLTGCAGSSIGGGHSSVPQQVQHTGSRGRLSVPAHIRGAAPPRLPGENVRRYLERVATKIQDSDVDSHIDSDVVGQDRSVIKSVMLSEPQYARENVVFVDQSGRIYSNHRAMAAATHIAKPVPGQPALLTDESGHTFAAPPATEKPRATGGSSGTRSPLYGQPPATTSTGPYRRVYSDPETWWSGGMHVVFPNPATNDNSVGPYGDIGYMYSGGFSSSGADGADAGLQYSAARNVADVFISVASTHLGQVYNTYREFPPNTDVEVDFIIGNGGCTTNCQFNSANLTSFNWGSWVGGGFGGVTIAVQPSNISDWTSYGVVLKDMITIGQSNPPGGVGYDGYAFGYIEADYCGWDGPNYNLCLANGQGAGHYFGQQVPDASVVDVTSGTNGYWEDVGILLY